MNRSGFARDRNKKGKMIAKPLTVFEWSLGNYPPIRFFVGRDDRSHFGWDMTGEIGYWDMIERTRFFRRFV